MKKYLVVISSLIIIASLFFVGWQLLFDKTVFFASLESKGIDHKTVYNEIKFFKKDNFDIWMMNQSHFGIHTDKSKIDRLAIVVDRPSKSAKFYQLPPGELVWTDDLPKQKIEFRVSCFMCHANGPRAIRADNVKSNLNTFQKLKINFWNYKIKAYGRINADPMHTNEDINLKMPFRYRAELDNEKLNIKTCNECHNEKNGRGELTRQNLVTIDFLLKNKLMPPSGYALSESEKSKIEQFIIGL